MSFGFPGANTGFEQHDLHEESFWPSFTDIMMVIVMVFLLVAISVILNNYQLVKNLKQSMLAQQLASSIAEDTQMENSSLEERLQQLKQQLAAANIQIVNSKKSLEETRSELQKSQQIISELNAISNQQTQQLDEKTAYFATLEQQSKQQLEAKNKEIFELQQLQQTQLDELNTTKNEAKSQQQLITKLQQQEKDDQNKIEDLQAQIKSLRNSLTENASEYLALQKQLTEKSSEIETLQQTLTEQSNEFSELKIQRQSDESQLLSLQGELDSLDKKYQKLLRPARSPKGKFVVAVRYTKYKGRGIYRLRSHPRGEYRNVSRRQLERKMVKLKKKHGDNLYVKVVIPKNSGLSYNEALKFTSFMQKSYDYYFQEEQEDKTERN